MEIGKISIETTTDFFLKDPQLCLLGLPDDYLGYLGTFKKFPETPGEDIYGIYEDNSLVAIVMFQEHSKTQIAMHYYLSSNHLRKDIVVRCYSAVEEMLRNNYDHKEVLVQVPASCPHVMEVISNIGFTFNEIIQDGVVWRGKKENLHCYTTKINQESK